MRKIFENALVLAIIAFGSFLFFGGFWTTTKQNTVYSSQDISAFRESITDTVDTTSWIMNGDESIIYVGLSKDSTYWSNVLGGDSLSLGFEVELYRGPVGSVTATGAGYWQHGTSSGINVMSLTTADTSHPLWYYQFPDSLEGSYYMRIITRAGVKHMRRSLGGIDLDVRIDTKNF